MSEPTLRPTLLNGAQQNVDQLPVLVLGPSLGTSAKALFAPIAPELAEHFALYAWDLPGHGDAPVSTEPFTMAELAAAVRSMLTALRGDGFISQQPVYYAGVSIGGAVGVQLAHDAAGNGESDFVKFAVICSAAKISTPEAWRERAELVDTAGTGTVVAGSAQRWFAPGFLQDNAPIGTELLRSLQYADRHAYAHACHALAGFDLRENLPNITAPLLAIAGVHDPVCPPDAARFLAENVADGRWIALDGVAHLAPAEDPKATAAALIEFFTAKEQA